MLTSILLLVIGLALVLQGGQWFVTAAVKTAESLRMPRVVIGSTLVSLATTMPEMSVSVMAGLKGESGLAVGNAIGSVICNIALILGVTAALRHVDVDWRAYRFPIAAMMLAGVALLLMTLDLHLRRWQGALLVLAGAVYFASDFWTHYRERKPWERTTQIKSRINDHEQDGEGDMHCETQSHQQEVNAWRIAIQFMAGAAVVLLGSRLLVGGAVDMATGLGIPSIIIGLTVVALGTSLPELVTGITSARKAVSDLSVGNVLGANIANLTLVVGAAALIRDVTMDRVTQLFNFPAMLLVMALLVWMMSTDRRLSRREGVALLGVYVLYLAILVFLTYQCSGAASKG